MKTGLDSSNLKSEAISIARSLVRKHGYEKFRLSDVARDLGISHAALYKYFNGKEELLDAVNIEWLKDIDDSLGEIAYNVNIDARARIKLWFVRLYTMKREKVIADIEPYSALIAAEEQKKPFIQEHLDQQFRQLRSIVEEAFPKVDADRATQQLLNATSIYHYPQMVKNGVHKDITSDLEQLIDVLIAGLNT